MNVTNRTYRAWGIDGGVHVAHGLKPLLTPDELIKLLKSKGITFRQCNEYEASHTLSNRDSFLHIAEYRKLFPKHLSGVNKGKYIDLDFADLLDLDLLDNDLRRTFLSITNDIERIAKIDLLNRIEMQKEDGYSIVADFIGAQSQTYRKIITNDLKHRRFITGCGDIYSGRLIEHYQDAMPVWVFLEVVPFGTKLAFMLFCADRWGDVELNKFQYELSDVKDIRNCCSHLSCILNGFRADDRSAFPTSFSVQQWLTSKGIKSTKSRRSKLKNRRIQQLLTALAVFDTSVYETSTESREKLLQLSEELKDRIQRYSEHNGFVSYISFLEKVIDAIESFCKYVYV
ncbi:MAG: Abi family protein [Eggerthellaceae bacterium]|nr:Abi family protein [Eggerthellaceae bacterium]